MCYDISYTSGIELITDYLPGLHIEEQLHIPFELFDHVQAQSYRKYPVILFEAGEYKLRSFHK